MSFFTKEQKMEDSMSSVGSSKSSLASGNIRTDENNGLRIKGSFHNIFKKRKRQSPSPSPTPPCSSTTSPRTPVSSSRSSLQTKSDAIPRSVSLLQTPQAGAPRPSLSDASSSIDRSQNLGQPDPNAGSVPACMWPGRRPSSTRLRRLLPPQSFTPSDLESTPVLSRPHCRIIGTVSQPHPEPGWRVLTKARSPESALSTFRPLYFANLHSPLVTGKSMTIYFEGEIRPGNSDDVVCLAMGFFAGRDRAVRMPGFERWSLGIQCCEGRVYVNGDWVENIVTGGFERGQQVGIGLTFSVSSVPSPQIGDTKALASSSSPLDVELFMSRDGRKIGSWELRRRLGRSGDLLIDGLAGAHDLYAAVGTLGEVNVDILLEATDWMYQPEAR